MIDVVVFPDANAVGDHVIAVVFPLVCSRCRPHVLSYNEFKWGMSTNLGVQKWVSAFVLYGSPRGTYVGYMIFFSHNFL